jgi:hypothetical protein
LQRATLQTTRPGEERIPDARLIREQKVHVVTRLACYDTPTAIVQSLGEQRDGNPRKSGQ